MFQAKYKMRRALFVVGCFLFVDDGKLGAHKTTRCYTKVVRKVGITPSLFDPLNTTSCVRSKRFKGDVKSNLLCKLDRVDKTV